MTVCDVTGHDGPGWAHGQVLLEAWLHDHARQVVTALLNGLMEVERDELIGCGTYERCTERRGYRNGYEPRWLDTGFGRLSLRRPRVRAATTRWDEALELIITDGDGGLEAARLTVYDGVPHQRCVFHRLQNLADHVTQRGHLEAMRWEAAAIYADLEGIPQAWARLQRWVKRWMALEPQAVKWFADEFDLTLRYLTVPKAWRSRVKTTNPVERFIRELSRQFGRSGICPSEVSWERATYLTWQHLKHGGYAPTRRHHLPPEFTRTS